MPPAFRNAMAGEFLVPLLRTEGGCPDPVAIATWHLALGSAVAVEVPNDLFALWLFPAAGGAVLLGPEALAEDHLAVPVPAPILEQDELFRLEETLRRAQYPSALAAPVRHDGRDVGLMLLGSFRRGAFGPQQALALRRLAAKLALPLAELAQKMPSSSQSVLEHGLTRETMPDHLARAACEAVSGPDLVRRVSGILYPLLPHDRLEILVSGAVPDSFIGLSGTSSRRRWSGVAAGMAAGGIEPLAGIVARFGDAASLLVADLEDLETRVNWSAAGHPLPVRSLLGARLAVGGATAGYLLLGSVARDAYRPEDEDLLALAALMLAPRVAALRTPSEAARAEAVSSEARESPLIRAAAVLADTAHLGEGLRGFAEELRRLVPHEAIAIELRRGDAEVISLDPDAPRPFADLPGMPVAGFEGAEVLREEREWLSHPCDEGEEIVVPLKVAGRTMGTLGVRSIGFPSAHQAAAIARQFADLLAPHLELLRRGSATGSASRLASVGPKPLP